MRAVVVSNDFTLERTEYSRRNGYGKSSADIITIGVHQRTGSRLEHGNKKTENLFAGSFFGVKDGPNRRSNTNQSRSRGLRFLAVQHIREQTDGMGELCGVDIGLAPGQLVEYR